VKSRRVGGSNYQVPVEVNPNRRLSLSIRWFVGYATSSGGRNDAEKLAKSCSTPPTCAAGAVKKREETHRMGRKPTRPSPLPLVAAAFF
jgi:small subunit ribosomal protein S7